jgi:hypothetical protein
MWEGGKRLLITAFPPSINYSLIHITAMTLLQRKCILNRISSYFPSFFSLALNHISIPFPIIFLSHIPSSLSPAMTTGLQAVFIARTIPAISLGVSPKKEKGIKRGVGKKSGTKKVYISSLKSH